MSERVKHLYLLRHAKSSWSDPDLADHDRPLSARGARDAHRVAEWLHQHGIAPEMILCSSARRTRDTLAPILDATSAKVRVHIEEVLYAAREDQLLARLRGVPDTIASVMLIGHNPGLQDLAVALAGDGPRQAMERLAGRFPTAALATLELPLDRWRGLDQGAARLVDLLTPKRLTNAP